MSALQSAIVLSQLPKGIRDDSFLTTREIAEMTLHAEMAVLSAYKTTQGQNKEGEGIVGLTWALFMAGVSTQVIIQCKVDDAITLLLMENFTAISKQDRRKGKH